MSLSLTIHTDIRPYKADHMIYADGVAGVFANLTLKRGDAENDDVSIFGREPAFYRSLAAEATKTANELEAALTREEAQAALKLAQAALKLAEEAGKPATLEEALDKLDTPKRGYADDDGPENPEPTGLTIGEQVVHETVKIPF